MLDLGLLGATGAHDRLLDLACGVFVHRDAVIDGTHDYGAADLPRLECGVRLLGHEHAFDGELLGPVEPDQLRNPGIDLGQFRRQVVTGYRNWALCA